jgi:nucleoside-triphosphatase THEP1
MSIDLPSVWNITFDNLLGNKDDIPVLAPIGHLPIQVLKDSIDQSMRDSSPLINTVHRHIHSGLVAIIVRTIITLFVILVVKYRMILKRFMVKQLQTHLPTKPTAPPSDETIPATDEKMSEPHKVPDMFTT